MSALSATAKEERLSLRATAGEKALLTQAAQARHTTVSQFVLEASLRAAHALLASPAEFSLLPDQWEAFCQRLDAPPRTIPVLQALFSEPEPFGGE